MAILHTEVFIDLNSILVSERFANATVCFVFA